MGVLGSINAFRSLAFSSGLFAGIRQGIENNLLTEDRWKVMLDGLEQTVIVSLLSVLAATLAGALLCALRMSKGRRRRRVASAYIELMRSLPILILLLVMFYIVLAPLGWSPVCVAVICFAMYYGAYVCEIFRSGIEGVDRGQSEAGAALGMTPTQTFCRIVLPQALLRVIPVYKGQMTALIKNTSIVGYVAIVDLTKAGDVIRTRTFDAFFPLLLVAAVYLLLTFLFGLLLDALERKLTPKSGHSRAVAPKFRHSRAARGVAKMLVLVALFTSCSGKKETDAQLSQVTTVEQLVGHSVAVAGGGSQDIYLSSIPGIDVIRLSASEIVLAVESGTAEFGIIQEEQFRVSHLERRGMKIAVHDVIHGECAVGFRKTDTEICNTFNRFIAEFRENGEYDALRAGWLDNQDSMEVVARSVIVPTEGPEYVVGITHTFPYIYLKGDGLTGMEIDIMNRFARYAGIVPRYETQDFNALIPALNSGKIDIVLSHLKVTEERAKHLLFSDPYGEAGVCVYYHDGSVQKEKFLVRVKESFHNNLIAEKRWKQLLDGLVVTLEISVLALLAALVMGALLCLLRMNRRKWIQKCIGLIINLIRGIPLLVVLMIVFYVVFASVRISGTMAAVISFGIYYSAYFCEVFRSGMESVGKGQWEAGAALGLSKFETFRLVALPQALRRIIPVLKGEIVGLIKATSIVGYVAVVDLTKASELIRVYTLDAFFPLITVTIVYFFLSKLSNWLLDGLDRKING